MQRLKKKLEFEWEKFFLGCQCTSKANIFAMAMEISKKQEIKTYLMQLKKENCNEMALEKMLIADNTIDACYRYVMDCGISNLSKGVENWMNSL